MITVVDDFFTRGCGRCARFDTDDCAARQWASGLRSLRQLCLAVGLDEMVKWGHPCYVHCGRNVAIVGALRGDFRLTFFQAALLRDPAGVLERQGPNTRHPDMIRFTDAAQVAAMATTVQAYLQEAMSYARDGVKAPREVAATEFPAELMAALAADEELAAAFQRLTPGRQRSVVIHLNGARQPKTRVARLQALRGPILAGKGARER